MYRGVHVQWKRILRKQSKRLRRMRMIIVLHLVSEYPCIVALAITFTHIYTNTYTHTSASRFDYVRVVGTEPSHTRDEHYQLKVLILDDYNDGLKSDTQRESELKRQDEKKRKLREEQQRVIQNSVTTLKDKQQLAKKPKKTTTPASLSPSSLSSSSPTSLSPSCASRADLTRIAAEQVNVTRTLRDDTELHQRRMEALLERSVVAQEQSSQALKEFARRAEQKYSMI